jgi:glutaredoxin
MGRMAGVAALAAALLLAALPAAGGEMYRWKDANGVTHFSDSPPEASAAGNVKAWEMPADPGGRAQAVAPVDGRSADAPPARKNHTVTLYTTSWCPRCKEAKAFLTSLGIPFTELDTERNVSAKMEARRINPKNTVPVAVIDGRVFVGFGEEYYLQALGMLR